jgi:hypothetical protein
LKNKAAVILQEGRLNYLRRLFYTVKARTHPVSLTMISGNASVNYSWLKSYTRGIISGRRTGSMNGCFNYHLIFRPSLLRIVQKKKTGQLSAWFAALVIKKLLF